MFGLFKLVSAIVELVGREDGIGLCGAGDCAGISLQAEGRATQWLRGTGRRWNGDGIVWFRSHVSVAGGTLWGFTPLSRPKCVRPCCVCQPLRSAIDGNRLGRSPQPARGHTRCRLHLSSAGRSHLPFQLSQFISSESGLNPFGEAAKFLAQPLGLGVVVVLNGVLQKRVQPDLLNCIVSPPSTTGFI